MKLKFTTIVYAALLQGLLENSNMASTFPNLTTFTMSIDPALTLSKVIPDPDVTTLLNCLFVESKITNFHLIYSRDCTIYGEMALVSLMRFAQTPGFPSLRQLTFEIKDSSASMHVDRAIGFVITRLRGLRSFTLKAHDPPFGVLTGAASLSGLEEFKLDLREPEDDIERLYGFASLTKLDLRTEAEPIIQITSSILSKQLEEVTLVVRRRNIPKETFDKLFNGIGSFVNLTSLRICFGTMVDMEWCTVEPLLACTSLKEVVLIKLYALLLVNDENLLQIGTAWPNLERLVIANYIGNFTTPPLVTLKGLGNLPASLKTLWMAVDARNVELPSTLPVLTELNLIWSAGTTGNHAAVAEAICQLAPKLWLGQTMWANDAGVRNVEGSMWREVWEEVRKRLNGRFRLGTIIARFFDWWELVE